MENARLFGIMGFAIVIVPFTLGLSGSISSGKEEPKIQDQTIVVEAPKRLTYIPYNMPLTTSLSKFSKHVTVSISFMIDENTGPANELQNQIDARQGRLEAILIDAIIEAGEAVVNANDLRVMIPRMARHAINTQIGDANNPSPVHEVLITAFAMQ